MDVSLQTRVVQIYRVAGLNPLPEESTTPDGYVYSEGNVALARDFQSGDYAIALHDLAHWLAAPPERRSLPNFGLGPHPTFSETAQARTEVPLEEAELEEGLASVVNIALAHHFLNPYRARKLTEVFGIEHLYTEGAQQFRPARDPHLAELKKRGLYPFPTTLQNLAVLARSQTPRP